MVDIPDDLGPRLRALRIDQGISLSAFARRVYYTKGYLSRVETGRQTPSLEFVRRCEAELGAVGALASLVELPTPVQPPTVRVADGGEETWIMTMTPGGSSFTP